MKTSLFSFELPSELIAQEPPAERGRSRLMVLDRNRPDSTEKDESGLLHRYVKDLPSLIEPGTLMVFNDTRVRKARLFAKNILTGGKGEFLLIKPTSDGEWECIVDKARKKKTGQLWSFPGGITGTITGEPASDRRTLSFSPVPAESWFEEFGHIPLPPYMRRPDTPEDAERYQTVYAKNTGSAAAPTAGLHFTPEILKGLEAGGIETAWLTLDVGLGTFAPVRTESIFDHPMHSETYELSESTAVAVNRARSEGRKILAVGTTSVRTLEASWNGSETEPGRGQTELFIYPGYRFNVVDQIFTNFHTPQSSLLMLISAYCGRERLLEAYSLAIEKRYRFFSYGDAMLCR